MFGYRITFDSPAYLLLLALIPVVWLLSFRSLSSLGRWRRPTALALRAIVLALIAMALAEPKFVRTSDRLTVIYLLDQSRSIPAQQREAMVAYAKAEVARHRNESRQDRAGVIVFGGDAKPEIPPFDDQLNIIGNRIESTIDGDHTNLAAAMKMAQAMFPPDSARRIVIISDGNENQGQALAQAEALAQDGVSIYTVPVHYPARAEVAVEKMTIPPNVNRGQPFDLRVVLNNTASPSAGDDGRVKGRLRIVRKIRDTEEVLQDEAVTLDPGKSVFTLREEITSPDFYTYEARFVPDDGAVDDLAENNRASAFTHVRGQGQVLLVENFEPDAQGEHDFFVERLRENDLEVTRQPSDQLFANLSELQPFDAVVLGNVPREHFSDAQIQMLVSNTQQMGAGLMMLGGENSFGAGGWTNTELEKAMPVDFQIKNSKVQAIGALALLMHASEMPDGNHWQKVVAMESIKALGSQDFCGLIHYGAQGDQWLWGGMRQVGPMRQQMLARLDRMAPGDMPHFEPAMKMAAAAFAGLPPTVAVKHMIIISDGDPSPPSNAILQALSQQKVTVTTVAIGSHGQLGSSVMQGIATATGGKYHVVRSANALPKIYQKEVRAVARPLIYQSDIGFSPQLKYPHQITKDIEQTLPPITGFVMTNRKQSQLAETLITSPRPEAEENATILAAWNYGAGKSVALTTDVGHRWAHEWQQWPNYDKLVTNMVRWAMRPPGDQGNFSVVTDVQDGKVQAVITALDKDDQFINFLDMSGTVVGPDMKPRDVKIQQTAPGRYVAEFPGDDAGSYFMMLSPGAGLAPIRTGINVPYSAEFLDREPNESLLRSLASLTPSGGESGQVVGDLSGAADIEPLLEVNTFEHNLPKASSRQDIWFLLVWLAGLLFFCDVFTRRVAVNFDWVAPLAVRVRDTVLRREPAPAPNVVLDRLRSRKAEISEQLDQRRSSVRFEPTADASADPSTLEQDLKDSASAADRRKQSAAPMAPEKAAEEDTYTSRLLKAKKKAAEQRDDKTNPRG